jgi:hypothetical protein
MDDAWSLVLECRDFGSVTLYTWLAGFCQATDAHRPVSISSTRCKPSDHLRRFRWMYQLAAALE